MISKPDNFNWYLGKGMVEKAELNDFICSISQDFDMHSRLL
jgi:hypothetical protein